LLYAEETIGWRFARPRRGWWRRAPRARRPTRPLRQGQITPQERGTRQTGLQARAGSRITRGVWLSVIGAVHDGPSQGFSPSVPHWDAQEVRHYLHQGMAACSQTGQEVVMVVDRRGSHRGHKRDATLDHYHGTCRWHCLPAHWGHHRNPIAGFWRVLKDAIGAGRCFPKLFQLYTRPRQVLMAHQERPIYAFHW
jgi:DDE superfamily endonuclease